MDLLQLMIWPLWETGFSDTILKTLYPLATYMEEHNTQSIMISGTLFPHLWKVGKEICTFERHDKILEKLMSTLDDINKNGNYNDESINKIGYAIFNMATSNKFNSNVYARLCSKLKARYEFMTNIIMTNITEFMKLFENMKFVSPEENYDEFCEMNITNDKRRSMSLFLTNLYKNNVITLDFVYQNINNVQNMIMINTTNSEKKSEIDELSEILYILLTNIPFLVLIKHNDWIQLHKQILEFTNLNNKIHTGITSKSKFKHMDIMDKLK